MEANLGLTRVPVGLVQDDTLLPSQHFTPYRQHVPEQRLMIAVLQDAIDCLEKYRSAKDPRGRQHFEEVTRWLLAEETRWPFSFQCICEVLGLDAGAVRHHLRLAPARRLEQEADRRT